MNSSPTRRDFLKTSAAATAALGFPNLIPASAFGAGNKITLGCIGVGGRGTALMRNFLAFDEVRVLAVCDPFTDRRQKAKEAADQRYGDKGCALRITPVVRTVRAPLLPCPVVAAAYTTAETTDEHNAGNNGACAAHGAWVLPRRKLKSGLPCLNESFDA